VGVGTRETALYRNFSIGPPALTLPAKLGITFNVMNVALDKPCLPAVARALLDGPGSGRHADLARVVVVVPGSRARRRLLELLCEQAASAHAVLSPPRVVTPRLFCALVSQSVRETAAASEAEQLASWRQAVEDERAVFDGFLVGQPDAGRHPWDFLGLARRLMQLHASLRGERLTMAVVADRVDSPAEHERWLGLASVERRYKALMTAHGLEDTYAAFEAAMDDIARGIRPVPDIAAVWSVGVVDAFGQYAAALDAVKDRLTVVTHGAAEWFDARGFLSRPGSALKATTLDLPDAALRFVDTPADQAREALSVLASETAATRRAQDAKAKTTTALAYGDIVVGVPDADVIEPLVEAFSGAGVRTHSAAGVPFRQSELGMLCAALEDYLHPVSGKSLASLMAVVRHPLVAAACEAHQLQSGGTASLDDQLGLVTRFAAEHLVASVESPRAYARDSAGAASGQKTLAGLLDLLHGPAVLGSLEGTASLADWAGRLTDAFGRLCTDTVPAPAGVSLAVHNEAIAVWCRTARAVSDSRVPWAGVLTAHAALQQLAALCGAEPIVVPADAPSVELVGWLELALDDAPVVLVTGLNEGLVPESVTADMFLPDGLRRLLGMPDNERRLQRDRYLLRTLAVQGRRTVLISGRRSAQNEPRKPSRLILDADTTTRAKRLKAFFTAKADSAGQAMAAGAAGLKPPEPEAVPPSKLPRSISVTDFKKFLACPYKYYLERIGKIEEPDEPGSEIDAKGFGTLVHEGLRHYGRTLEREDNDKAVAAVCAHVERFATGHYGSPLHPAVRLQLDAAKRRIEKAIEVMRNHRHIWRVALTDSGEPMIEQAIELTVDVDGTPMIVKGKIDRIETNGTEYRVLDFKTGDASVSLSAKGGIKKKVPEAEAWRDLQLPLYAWWARTTLCNDTWPEVGYFLVGRSMAKIGVDAAKWPAPVFESAFDAARLVISAIRRGGPFSRTDTPGECRNCGYKGICQR